MKVHVDKSDLCRALSHATRLIEKRSPKAILSHVKLRALEDGQHLEISSTDLTMMLVEKVPATIDMPGAVTVSATMAHEITTSLPDKARITLELSDADSSYQGHASPSPHGSGANQASAPLAEVLEVKSGMAQFKLATLPVEDFPTFVHTDMPPGLNFTPGPLAQALKRCSYAMGEEDGRYYLNGVYVHSLPHGDGKTHTLNVAATDGHQMARVCVPDVTLAKPLAGVILGRKAVMEISRLLNDNFDGLTIQNDATTMRFLLDDTCVLNTRLVEATYPPYARVIPKDYTTKAIVPVDDLTQAVERVALVSAESMGAVRVSFGVSKLLLSAKSLEYGSARDEVPITLEGEPLEIGFNALYLLNVLRACQAQQLEIRLKNAGTAVSFVNPDEPDSIFVIMPMMS